MDFDLDVDPDAAPATASEAATSALGARTVSDNQTSIFELYKLAVEMADRVSARRTAANNFFLALHGVLATVVGAIGLNASGAPGASNTPTLVAGVAGILLCAAWWLGLRSYRDLNSAKFKVITALEERLPIRLFGDEWRYLKGDDIRSWRARYAEQGTVERFVPFIFAGLYVFAIARNFSQ